MAGVLGAKAGAGAGRVGARKGPDEEEAGTSTSLSSNSSSSASLTVDVVGMEEVPTPLTAGPAGDEEMTGLAGRRRKSVRMLDQLEKAGLDIEEGAGLDTKGPAAVAAGRDEDGDDGSSSSGSGSFSMSPETAYYLNKRSVGGRKPATLQDIKTEGALCAGLVDSWGWGLGLMGWLLCSCSPPPHAAVHPF